MPTARTATVSVTTMHGLSFTLKSSPEFLVFISAVHAAMALASFLGTEEGEERAPGTHCLRMCIIIAKATW